MALIRILIDGYSLLHNWPELAPGKARYSAAAREELLHYLRLYQDAAKIPLTVIFDGANAPVGTPKVVSTPDLEVLFSSAGKTADDMIERATQRLLAYGEVMVVTDDLAERDTVIGLGGLASSCENFIRTVGGALKDLDQDLKQYNLKEKQRYNRPRT